MAIRAVVLDIGGVLEVIDDSIFPGGWPERLGMSEQDFAAQLQPLTGDATLGRLTETALHAEWQRRLGLTHGQLAQMRADCWRWYVGTLDRPLFDWFAAVRSRQLKAGILSNSGPGAREAERHHGFEDVTDDIVYSHEVGLMKPDPAAYALTGARLAVEPHEVVFLDDAPLNVEGARAAGWHAVHHVSTPESIAELERIIAAEGPCGDPAETTAKCPEVGRYDRPVRPQPAPHRRPDIFKESFRARHQGRPRPRR